MRYRAVAAAVMIAGMTGGVVAAQDPVDVLAFGQVQVGPLPAPPMGSSFGVVAFEPMAMGDPVVNAPYSADIVTEIIQELADGNRIERKTTSTVARDGRGRVRREHEVAAIGPMFPEGDARMITISDPVERVHYALDPVRKSATRSRPPLAPGDGPRDMTMFTRRVGPMEEGDRRTEKLGSKEVEGVRADGVRTVVTVPAGAIGNVRPIEVVNERWYSPELRVVVYSRRADPRFGETIYRLTNIVRAEPDPSLFQVPADYKQQELKGPHFGPKVGVAVKPPL